MKTSKDYENERAIGYAMFRLGWMSEVTEHLATESCLKKLFRIVTSRRKVGNTVKLLKDIQPLIKAARAREWQSIADAAIRMKDRNIGQELAIDHQLQMIAMSPRLFGVEFLSKADVLFIMQTTTPGWKVPSDMRKKWKILGLDHLAQGRGDATELNKWAKKYQASRKGAFEIKISQMGYPIFYLRS